MKVYVDVSMIMVGTRFTGIPRVVMELMKRIDSDVDLQFIEYSASGTAFEIIDKEKFVEFCKTGKDTRRKMRSGRYLAFTEFEPSSVFFDIDTVWKTRVRRSFLYPLLKKSNVKIVTHIYDIIPITHPQFCDYSDALCFADFFGASLEHADELLVNSEATKKSIDEVCDRIGHERKMIKIVPLGGNFAKKEHDEADVSDLVKKIVQRGKYVLMVGTIEPRKNHKIILDAYDLGLPSDLQVVFAGFMGQGMEELSQRLEQYKDQNVWYVGQASDADVDYLYKNCFALVYPSHVEGYGLPIMEAFCRNVLVIASDTDINMEIGGERAVYFSNDSAEELRRVITDLYQNEEKQKALKDGIAAYKAPSWDDCADRIKTILKVQE